MKTFLVRTLRGELQLAAVFSVLFAISALGQTASTQISPGSTAAPPAKGIGPAAANTPQHQILTSALSPETRQTLQEAMNSVHPAGK